MTLEEGFTFLNFWINKKLGAWYTISELELITDRGSMSLFSDMRPRYARDQVVKEALAPFRHQYPFTTLTFPTGVANLPSNTDFIALLDIQIYFQISNITRYYSVPMINEDEISDRLNSQLNPVTATSPIGEVTSFNTWQLYPKQGYDGRIVYFKRPNKPVFAYNIISGRVIVFDQANSTNLNWNEDWQNAVYIKALSSIGINLTSAEIANYAQLKTQENFQNVNRL